MKTIVTIASAALGAAMIASSAGAQITVVEENNAFVLAQALLGGNCGGTLSNFTLSGHSNGVCSSTGLFTAGINNYELLGTGIVLSTGCAKDYSSGPNTSPSFTTNFFAPATPAQEAMLDPITGGAFSHFDVTTLSFDFTPPAGVTGITFEVVFGSDGFMEQVGTQFIDGFAAYLNGVNIAFNPSGPLTINNPVVGANVVETELDDVLLNSGSGLPVQFIGGSINPGLNNLTLVVGDASDGNFDTTVYIKRRAFPVVPCPPAGTTSRLYTITGNSNGVGWSWCINSPDFAAGLCDLSVLPVPPGGTALDLATAFANSINSRSCGSNRLFAVASPGAAGSADLMVSVGDVSGSMAAPAWTLSVGSPCSTPNCTPVANINTCPFNPTLAEVPLSGQDCNSNNQDDTIDIALGTSADANQDGVPDECLCPQDVDPPGGDGQVNINDLFAVIAAWGPCPQPCPPYCQADVDADCMVDIDDLFAVIAAWGPCP